MPLAPRTAALARMVMAMTMPILTDANRRPGSRWRVA
jgi:hypothetical protein